MYDLFSYPLAPGFKVSGGTSEAAAPPRREMSRLQLLVVGALAKIGPSTSDEIAEYLTISPFSIRPRLSELRALGAVVMTGETRTNHSGKRADVLRLA